MKTTHSILFLLLSICTFGQNQTYTYSIKETAAKVRSSDGTYSYKTIENIRGNYKHTYEKAVGSMTGKELLTIYENGVELEYFIFIEEMGYTQLGGKTYKHSILAPSKTETQLGLDIYRTQDLKEIIIKYKNELVFYKN
jgi:hypothetical protein